MRNKNNLKWSLDNLKRKYQKHLCQLELIYAITLNQLFWKLTKEKFTLHEVNFGGAAKISIMLHIIPWTLMLMVRTRQSIYLVLANVLSTSFLMFHITFNEISTTLLSIQLWYKGRYTRYMWSNDVFILWNCTSAIFYKDR